MKVKEALQKRATQVSQAQLVTLPRLLFQWTLAHGFETDNWTKECIAELIAGQFGVDYHPFQISKT